MSPITLLKLASIGLMSISSCLAAGPAPVNLGAAGNFAVLAKSGISSVPPSSVLGNMGISPAASTFITGFSLILSPSGTFATSTQVVGQVLAATFKSPTPSTLTTSVGAFITAFNDANGRSNPTATGLGAGSIGGLTFAPGLYKWGTGVNIATDITISGTSLDTWIFQIAGTLTTASAVNIILVGGALPQNIVWVVSGAVTIGSTSVVNGIFMGATSIALNTGATVNGRLLSQTAVTLEQATVNAPTATTSTITSTATSFSTSTVTATVTSTDTTTLSVTTTVVVTLPPATTTVGTGPSNQCNTGSLQCCASTQSATSSSIAGLLALLGVVVGSITGLVGVTCSPITAIGLGGTSCSEQPVCCTNNTFNGIIALGCTPINLNL